jgi:hypothetical protein
MELSRASDCEETIAPIRANGLAACSPDDECLATSDYARFYARCCVVIASRYHARTSVQRDVAHRSRYSFLFHACCNRAAYAFGFPLNVAASALMSSHGIIISLISAPPLSRSAPSLRARLRSADRSFHADRTNLHRCTGASQKRDLLLTHGCAVLFISLFLVRIFISRSIAS